MFTGLESAPANMIQTKLWIIAAENGENWEIMFRYTFLVLQSLDASKLGMSLSES